MDTCEKHDDCIIVFKQAFGQKCPMCELEKELEVAEEQIEELESQ